MVRCQLVLCPERTALAQPLLLAHNKGKSKVIRAASRHTSDSANGLLCRGERTAPGQTASLSRHTDPNAIAVSDRVGANFADGCKLTMVTILLCA